MCTLEHLSNEQILLRLDLLRKLKDVGSLPAELLTEMETEAGLSITEDEMVAACRNSLVAFADRAPIRTKDGLRLFGEVKVPVQEEVLSVLEPAAKAAIEGRAIEGVIRRIWWEATKGYAKSWLFAVLNIWMVAFSKRMVRCQIAAADKDQAAEVRLAATEILQGMPWLSKFAKVDKWQIVNTSGTESVAEIIASDLGGSHGARPDALTIDEVTHVAKEDFVLNLLDNADKTHHGLVAMGMNAGQIDSWQHRLRESIMAQPGLWRMILTSGPAPFHDKAQIEGARRRNSASRFNRLWNGVWSMGGDALDAEDIMAAVREALGPMLTAERGYGMHGGLDIGIKHDHTGFAVLAMPYGGTVARLADCQSWSPETDRHVDLAEVEGYILEAHSRLHFTNVMFDPHQAEYLAERLMRQGVPMVPVPFTGKWLDRMASVILQAFRNGQIELYNDPALIRDLQRLQIIEKPYGYKLDAPKDKLTGHADRAQALALALLGTTYDMSGYMPDSADEFGDGIEI